jgi:threonine dehydrogenase-like Zn-dependent dehydrogenase
VLDMRGLVYHGAKDIRCETLPDPTPPDLRGAVVRVERAAICGSDLHLDDRTEGVMKVLLDPSR